MKLVALSNQISTYYVVPEHVAFLEEWDEDTKVHFIGGGVIQVDGDPNSVGMKLQGR